jgi:uncharacterized protein YbcV (DUF1398 family)
MDTHVKDVARELTRASDEERIAFPDVVKAMIENGIERYHADLVVGTKTYFMADGSHEMTDGFAPRGAAPAAFSAEGVAAALRAIQGREIGYRAFCDRIIESGCVGYLVSVAGKRAVYYGRTGDTYVEWFPGAKP